MALHQCVDFARGSKWPRSDRAIRRPARRGADRARCSRSARGRPLAARVGRSVAQPGRFHSEHRVPVGRFLRDALKHIPVLDDLAARIQPKDVDAGPLGIVRPMLMTVQHNEFTVREHSPELDMLSWILARHALKVRDEGFFAIRYRWIVLDVGLSNVTPHRLDWV